MFLKGWRLIKLEQYIEVVENLPEKCHKELDKVHDTVVLREGDLFEEKDYYY